MNVCYILRCRDESLYTGWTNDLEARLPWEHTSPGVSKGFLKREWRRAAEGVTTSDCTMTSCVGCGVCTALGVDNHIEGDRHGR